jgi:hypothetical protein
MTALLSALGSGISAKKILEYLMRQSPELAPKITKSLAAGISADKILKFFSKDKNFEKLTSSFGKEYSTENNANPLVQGENIRGKNLGQDPASALQRNLPGIAGGIAAGAALPFASRAAQSALSRALPHALSPGIAPLANASNTFDNSLHSNEVNTQKQSQIQQQTKPLNNQIPSQQPPINSELGNISQQKEITQPELTSNPKEYLEKLGILDRVKSLLKAGNSPESTAAALGIKRSGEAKIDPDLLKNIEEYSKLPKETENLGKIGEIPVEQEKISPEIKKQAEPLEEIEESIVATPSGFGEVKISRNGKSIVDVDGKKHSVEDEKILKPPKEAAIEAMELIKSFTPEDMRSTHHMLNSYDEEEKKGFFVFHNGDAYVVDDISPEEYEELSKEVTDAKTSGETIIGKWAKGHGSRGAGYNKIVKGHKDRKVVPELAKKFRKLKVGYNLLSEWQRLLNEK